MLVFLLVIEILFPNFLFGQAAVPQQLQLKQRQDLCKFYHDVKTVATEKDGIQVGLLVDQGVSSGKKLRTYLSTLVDQFAQEKPSAYDALKKKEFDIDLKICDLDLGPAICALGGKPKKAKEYNCDLEYCFDVGYWAFFSMDEKWKSPEIGIAGYKIKDGEILGFTYNDKNQYLKESQFPYLSAKDCEKVEKSK